MIPQTLGENHDPLDVPVLLQADIQTLCIVMANVIGVMRMIENNEADDKIIAVAADDTSVAHIHNITELPRHVTSELKHFFEEYKRLENTTVRIDESQDADNAKQIIPQAEHDYQQVHNGIV